MRHLSLASSFFAVAAINSQAGPAAAASMRLGRAPPAEDRARPEPQPSGGRPRSSPQSKAVAVRARSLSINPIFQGKLVAPDRAAGDEFGDAVAIYGNKVIVGAQYAEAKGDDSGAAYIFRRDGATWVEEAKLVPDDGATKDHFGNAVAMYGNKAVVCADGDENNDGSAYIYAYIDTSWVLEKKIRPPEPHVGTWWHYFCFSVAMYGNKVIVSALGSGDKGAAYIFAHDGSDWEQEAKLLAADGIDWDYFGEGVAMYGNKVIVGAPSADPQGAQSGAAYVYTHNGATWDEGTKLLPTDGAGDDHFGRRVGIYGNKVIVGARYDDNDNGDRSGSAYIFAHDGTSWTQEKKLLPADGTHQDEFGNGVAIYKDKVIVSASKDGDNGVESGSAYIFAHDGNDWVQEAKILPSDGIHNDRFGAAVAIYGDKVIVGTKKDDDSRGSAYIWGGVPTPSPTSSPTPSNIWTLEVQDTAATLAGGDDGDIKFTYLIAAGRGYEMSLLKKGCDTKDKVDGALYSVTNSTEVVNSTHQWLNVTYTLDKAALASSPIWNNVTSTIELCQVTSLYEIPNEQIGKLVVATSATELEVFVNSIANFTIATNLTSEKIFNETEEVDAAAAVEAFKCDDKFNRNNDKLSPNDEMFTCVRSKDAAFKVDNVDRMTISQTGKDPYNVIVGGKIQISSINSVDYTVNGAIVGSRIPINLFDFEEGKILTIEGAVTMKLAGGTSRRLNVDLGSVVRNLQDESNEASYTVDVALQAAEESAIGLSNSAAVVAAAALKGFAIAAFFLLL